MNYILIIFLGLPDTGLTHVEIGTYTALSDCIRAAEDTEQFNPATRPAEEPDEAFRFLCVPAPRQQ